MMAVPIPVKEDARAIGKEAEALSEQIVRRAASVGARFCYLLLDPSLRNPLEWLEATAAEYGLDLQSASIEIGRNDVSRARQPFLVQLKLDRYADTELCRVSAQMAVDDWDCDALRQGGGHRVGGWLLSSAGISDLARHLAGQAVHRRPSGGRAWVRFHDPRVMDVLRHIYDAQQRRQLCESVVAWLWLSRWQTLESLHQGDGGLVDDVGMVEPLSQQKWVDIDNIGPLNRLWLRAACAGIEVDRSSLDELRVALARAREYGFNDPVDLVEFGWRALRVHRNFDAHPRVRKVMEERDEGEFFGYVVADLSEAQWSAISEDMRRGH